MLRSILPLLSCLVVASLPVVATPPPLLSPDSSLAVYLDVTEGRPSYRVERLGQTVLAPSRLGLVRDDADLSRDLTLTGRSGVEAVEDHYEILTAKRRLNTYRANRQIFHFATATGQKLDVVFQVSDDGVAFRYVFPETSSGLHSILEEATSFRLPAGAKAWLQPMSVAKSGWKRVNPCYEEFYEKEIDVGTPSPLGAGWVYPALFRTGDTWIALTEAGLGRTYCATRLRHESPGGEYSIGFPDPRETIGDQPVHPHGTLPWATPWRVLAIGTLAAVAESTLGTDLAEPARTNPVAPEIQPGLAAWSWPLLGDSKTVFDVQKRFIDFAADMGWRYCLIDSMWDKQIGYERMKELADHARGRGVAVLLWYNTNGTWNDAPMTPKDRMHTREARLAEFTRLKAMGIAGLKIDFFGGDGQPVINLYHDILEDAAPFGLLINFHGSTLPRGWQRTYPHFMTSEAIRGFEYITFEQKDADQEPTHAAMLPFTRNLFDPMDFTPVCLDKLPGNRVRRTTPAFELALAVVFTSGIQHIPELPEAMAKMPGYVREFLGRVPANWDDTRLLSGYPGRHVTVARRHGSRWYVAGINSESAERTFTLDLARLAPSGRGRLIADGSAEPFRTADIAWGPGHPPSVVVPAHGGFVLVLDQPSP